MILDMISRQAENHLPDSSIRINRDCMGLTLRCSSVKNQIKVSENSKDYHSIGGWGIGGHVLVLLLSYNSVPLSHSLTSPFRRYKELWWNGELWRGDVAVICRFYFCAVFFPDWVILWLTCSWNLFSQNQYWFICLSTYIHSDMHQSRSARKHSYYSWFQ